MKAQKPWSGESAVLTADYGKGRNGRGQFTTGNPGRPVGARSRLSEHFLAAVNADWQEHGPEALKKVREERPQDYIRVIASLLPREVMVAQVESFEHLSDDELEREVMQMARQLVARERANH
jgi:hypothetical protein